MHLLTIDTPLTGAQSQLVLGTANAVSDVAESMKKINPAFVISSVGTLMMFIPQLSLLGAVLTVLSPLVAGESDAHKALVKI